MEGVRFATNTSMRRLEREGAGPGSALKDLKDEPVSLATKRKTLMCLSLSLGLLLYAFWPNPGFCKLEGTEETFDGS